MKMVSLKLSPTEAKDQVALDYKPPAYPWGTQLDLSDDALTALGWDKLPEVGTTLEMMATVKVCRVSANDSEEGGPNRCVCLQITDLGFGAGGDEKKSAAAKMLYDK